MTTKIHADTAYVLGNLTLREQGDARPVTRGEDALTTMAAMAQRMAWMRFGYDHPYYIGFDLTAHEDWSRVDAYFAEQYRERATGKPSTAPGIEITNPLLLERLYPERALYFQVRPGGRAPLAHIPGTVTHLAERPAT